MKMVERYRSTAWFCKVCGRDGALLALKLPCPVCGVDVKIDVCEECTRRLVEELEAELRGAATRC